MSAPLVMIVEDDEHIRDALAEALEIEGWQTICASNGREGWDLLRNGAWPSVVVLDLMMPEMNGYQLMALLQRDPELSRIPVIQVSASIQTPIPGVAAALPKPFLLEELVDLMTSCGLSSGADFKVMQSAVA